MFGTLIFSLIFLSDGPRSWEEVKVGQCLSIEKLQELSGVMDPEIYSGGKCSDEYIVEGQFADADFCGNPIDQSQWKREIIEHDEAGLFFPSPVPCRASVLSLAAYYEINDLIPIYCDEEDPAPPAVLFVQKETLKTKSFSAGQGRLYLPHPLRIVRKSVQPHYAYCHSTELSMTYEGWGALSGLVKLIDCTNDNVEFCKKARMQNSKNEAGDTCLKITRLQDC